MRLLTKTALATVLTAIALLPAAAYYASGSATSLPEVTVQKSDRLDYQPLADRIEFTLAANAAFMSPAYPAPPFALAVGLMLRRAAHIPRDVILPDGTRRIDLLYREHLPARLSFPPKINPRLTI